MTINDEKKKTVVKDNEDNHNFTEFPYWSLIVHLFHLIKSDNYLHVYISKMYAFEKSKSRCVCFAKHYHLFKEHARNQQSTHKLLEEISRPNKACLTR